MVRVLFLIVVPPAVLVGWWVLAHRFSLAGGLAAATAWPGFILFTGRGASTERTSHVQLNILPRATMR